MTNDHVCSILPTVETIYLVHILCACKGPMKETSIESFDLLRNSEPSTKRNP